MRSLPGTNTIATLALLGAMLGAMLGGCSDIYFDRRETITLGSGEAMAANRVTHAIDPWPPASAKRDIAYSGEKAATASERYRTGCVIRPEKVTSSSIVDSQAQQQPQCASKTQASSTPSGGGNSAAK